MSQSTVPEEEHSLMSRMSESEPLATSPAAQPTNCRHLPDA